METDNLDESGIGLDLDLDDPNLIDFNQLLGGEELLQASPDEMEPINFYEILSRPAPVQSASFKTESASSRTQIKQQLMKDQLLKENQRKRTQMKEQESRPLLLKVPINIQNVSLPHHVLQVRTGLQNPTKYHIMAKQKNQVLEYISSSQKGLTAKTTSQPPPSPFAAASPSVQSTSDAEEVIEGILAFEESSLDTQKSFYGSNASLESNRTKVEFDDRVKKETHNMIERRRRYNINDRIKELGDLLPQKNEEHYDIIRDSRANKGTILKSSVDYIKILKNDVTKMKQIAVDYRTLQQENRKLLLRIQHLEIQARGKGVALDQPTWKPAEPEAIIEQYVRGKSRGQMPDLVTEAACVYHESMDEVVLPDPMLSAAAVLPVPPRAFPMSPAEMDTE